MPQYRINYWDCNDMQTWLADIEAPSDAEAFPAAQQNLERVAIDPAATEVYSILNLESGQEVYLSSRAQVR